MSSVNVFGDRFTKVNVFGDRFTKVNVFGDRFTKVNVFGEVMNGAIEVGIATGAGDLVVVRYLLYLSLNSSSIWALLYSH